MGARRTARAAAVFAAVVVLAWPASSDVARARSVEGRHVRTGAYIPDPFWAPDTWPSALEEFDADAGRRTEIVQWYVQWEGRQPFPTEDAALVRARGQVPFITWESWDWTRGPNQPEYRDAKIARGRFDRYIVRWARAARRFGSRVFVRWGAEMNGDWNAWSPGVNRNTPAKYIAAWRHIHGIFEQVGATNVKWLWTPITNYGGSTPLRRVYPGNAYVDIVGIDGYNWGTTQPWSSWQSFSEVFNPTIANIRSFTRKPLWIAEVGSTEQGGNKAAWIEDMFATIQADARISGLVWFNAQKETDWRIQSSSAAQEAFADGLEILP